MKLSAILASAALLALAGPVRAVLPTPADVVDQYATEVEAEVAQTLTEIEAVATAGLRDLHSAYRAGARPFELEALALEIEEALILRAERSLMVLFDLGQLRSRQLDRLDARPFHYDALEQLFFSALLRYVRNLEFEIQRLERALDRMT